MTYCRNHPLEQCDGIRGSNKTYRNEQIRNLLLILLPGLAILGSAALDITHSAVGYHAGKEDWIEPWEWAVEAGDSTPHEGEVEIAGVVDLAGVSVLMVISIHNDVKR